MGLAGSLRVFDTKHKFRVEIDGFASADFSKVSGLEVEIEKIEHYEGGGVVPHKQPGLVKFSQLVLERGVCSQDTDFMDWVTSVVALSAAGAGATNTGAPTPVYERTLDIVQMDRDGAPVRRWTVYGAWPTKYMPGEWDGSQNEVVIETLTLEYRWFDKTL